MGKNRRGAQSKPIAATALLLVLSFLSACSEDSSPAPQIEPPTALPAGSFEQLSPALDQSAKEIALNYVELIATDFGRVAIDIEQLQSAIRNLMNDASEESLELAQQSWLAAHSAYELTTLHRYFAAQVLTEESSLELFQLQYLINYWPVIPGYVDHIEGYPDSGIVHDINVELNREALLEQHGTFDVAEVSLGFHVVEFLLWGNDSESGGRSASDYRPVMALSQAEAESGYQLEQLDNNRRRRLLTLLADSLVTDFNTLQTLWFEQLPSTRDYVESLSGPEVIALLADSMATMLSEELLLRSLYPMLNGDFHESIQSPYSRSTQNAVSTQLSGLERLLLELQSQGGTTLDLVFSEISNDFSELFYQNFDASKSCLVLLYSNFDSETAVASAEGEIAIVECINLLTNMVDHIERLKFELMN